MRWQRLYLAAVVLLVALVASIWLQHASDADEISRLRRYSPHGHHFIDTALTGGKVNWTSREIMIWRVRRRSHEFQSIDEFKAAFLNVAPHKQATIEVHHPTLNLNLKEGRESHERAEAILALLTEYGYENSGAVSN